MVRLFFDHLIKVQQIKDQIVLRDPKNTSLVPQVSDEPISVSHHCHHPPIKGRLGLAIWINLRKTSKTAFL